MLKDLEAEEEELRNKEQDLGDLPETLRTHACNDFAILPVDCLLNMSFDVEVRFNSALTFLSGMLTIKRFAAPREVRPRRPSNHFGGIKIMCRN